jgi:conjugal transfer mating pair stabilization protein TraN
MPIGSEAALTGVVCGEDLDGDGLIEEAGGELVRCVDRILCPLATVDCTPTYEPPVCEEDGALDPARDVCEVEPLARDPVDCPPGYDYVPAPTDRCEAPVMCASGSYTPAVDGCYLGDLTCPLGRYPCGDSGAGSNQCSPNRCVDLAVQPPVDTEADRTAYQDDGTVDPAMGSCSGLFLVFNGKASGDRFLFLEERCGAEARETASARVDERTVAVGSYCKKRIRFIGCLQRARVYCVFPSKLARMIHEQGRPQLEAFGAGGGWGTAQDPNCVGFTPEEFQALDFGEIDFGEFFGDIATPSADAIQDDMQRKIDAFYDGL